jgi:hypothetical protein
MFEEPEVPAAWEQWVRDTFLHQFVLEHYWMWPTLETLPSLSLADEAIELFAERARRVKPEFTVTEHNFHTVAEICRRLDGIPLAIELAAARSQMLTPAQIAQRLDERFRLLTGSVRGSASRHQTLRAAIDWSYDQLDDRERSVLARLAVFVGSFDLAAAETVAADGDVDALGVFEVLGQLVGKSLVVAIETSEAMAFRLRDPEARRRFVELARQWRLRQRETEALSKLYDAIKYDALALTLPALDEPPGNLLHLLNTQSDLLKLGFWTCPGSVDDSATPLLVVEGSLARSQSG